MSYHTAHCPQTLTHLRSAKCGPLNDYHENEHLKEVATRIPSYAPAYLVHLIQAGRADGYWVEAFPFSASSSDPQDINIVAYGLGFIDHPSKVEMFLNPFTPGNTSSSIHLAELEFPVAMTYVDITGNGFNDVIICDRYGPSMDELWGEDQCGGRVSWLESTGDPERNNWTRRTIGFSPGMHRLKAGQFSSTDRIQVCGAAIITAPSDVSTPAPIIIYTAPDNPRNTTGPWKSEIVAQMHLVHEVVVVHSVNGLDSILLAGRDGVDLLWYADDGSWKTYHIGDGLPEAIGNPHWGAGSVAVARVHSDDCGYIASSEAFHGNTISVYTKSPATGEGIMNRKWTRHVIDDFGPLNCKHTGSIHQVVCADIDGDGSDEILVAMMGSDPHSFDKTGVWCYKPIDLVKGTFAKFKLSNISAGRIATANFFSKDRLDFATISYSVPGYFESPNPSVNLFLSIDITAERLDDEVCFRVARPTSIHSPSELEFLDVAAHKLTLVLLPPDMSYSVPKGSSVKVMSGSLSWEDNQSGKTEERVLATTPFGRVAMSVNADAVRSGSEGTVFVLFKPSTTSGQPPYSSMEALAARNIIPIQYPADVRAMSFPWVKVEDRPWAHGRFDGIEFYNLVGFHVRYADDSDEVLAHIQLWTAGVGVSAGFHNHLDKSFCEIHACIVNGTGQGGMRWSEHPDNVPPTKDNTQLVVVPNMHEHGPLWRTRRDGFPQLRGNDTVDYPWHAWLAGDKSPDGKQSYDVWVAFEFPPFTTFSGTDAAEIEPGMYYIHDSSNAKILGILQSATKEGTPVVLYPTDKSKQTWTVSRIPGTELYQFINSRTGALLASAWPPEPHQRVVGTFSPGNMAYTASWAVMPNARGGYSLRLAGNETLTIGVGETPQQGNEDMCEAVLKDLPPGELPQSWTLTPDSAE